MACKKTQQTTVVNPSINIALSEKSAETQSANLAAVMQNRRDGVKNVTEKPTFPSGGTEIDKDRALVMAKFWFHYSLHTQVMSEVFQ